MFFFYPGLSLTRGARVALLGLTPVLDSFLQEGVFQSRRVDSTHYSLEDYSKLMLIMAKKMVDDNIFTVLQSVKWQIRHIASFYREMNLDSK
jgi:hypothetical protein